MKIYKTAVLPRDFEANGVACGLKRSHKLDLALFYSLRPAKAACQFTTNKILAAPILLDREHLKYSRSFRAIIVNSGNANCFTAEAGLKDARQTVTALSAALKVKTASILVSSTGIIGRRLPVQKIKQATPGLVAGLSRQGINKAGQAIMTTDKFAKAVSAEFEARGAVVRICGVAKGAGMIAPNMATMLAFILTDANISGDALKGALKSAVGNSFNCITVDGCMSTNDSLILLANSAAENDLITQKGKDFHAFRRALNYVCLELAKMIVRDAEGATKFIQIKVRNARDFYEARKIALCIANSNLFKTAIYGRNPNFGRIVAACGASGVDIKERDLKIKASPLDKREIFVEVAVNRGKSCATVYTSDLTPEYIKINAEYN